MPMKNVPSHLLMFERITGDSLILPKHVGPKRNSGLFFNGYVIKLNSGGLNLQRLENDVTSSRTCLDNGREQATVNKRTRSRFLMSVYTFVFTDRSCIALCICFV